MGRKVNPIGLRLGIITNWNSRWFGRKKEYADNLREDIEIRSMIKKKWKNAGIASINIERSTGLIRVIIKTSRPGILIGRGGTGIEDITKMIKQKFLAQKKIELKIEVQEVRQFEEEALLVAENVAEQLEKRIPFRRAVKSVIDQVEKNQKVKGVKIEIAGRLGGAEMSRREWFSRGTIPLHTLRADIDYARTTANTTYGSIGVKTWLYKGEVFEKNGKK